MGEAKDDNISELAAFIAPAHTEDAPASSQADEPAASTTVKSETKIETATAEPAKKEGEPKPSPSDGKTSVADALKVDDKEKKATLAEGEKDKIAATALKEQTPKSTWDSDENPYKRQAGAAGARLQSVEQQLRDTRNFSNQVNAANQTLRRQMARMEAKIDGTFDPEKEKLLDAEEQDGLASPAETTAIAELKGATAASLHTAYEQHGKEKVDGEVREFDRLFQNNNLMMQRVMRSPRPIQEALKILGEYRLAQKYGTQNLDDLIAKVREEAVGEARPKLVEEITREIMGKLSLKDKENQGIRGVRGGSRESMSAIAENNDEPKSLKQLFPN